MAAVARTSISTAPVRSTGSFTRVRRLPTRGMASPMHAISIVVYSVSVDNSQPMSALTG